MANFQLPFLKRDILTQKALILNKSALEPGVLDKYKTALAMAMADNLLNYELLDLN